MKTVNNCQHYILAGLLGIIFFISFPFLWKELRWFIYSKEAKAYSIGFPAQLGLKYTTSLPCIPSPPTNACPNHPLCAMMPPGACSAYTAITGTPAGGTGNSFLITQFALSETGFVPGADIIAAGTAVNFITVAASYGGCYGCLGEGKKNSLPFRLVEKIDNYFKRVKYYIAIKAPNK